MIYSNQQWGHDYYCRQRPPEPQPPCRSRKPGETLAEKPPALAFALIGFGIILLITSFCSVKALVVVCALLIVALGIYMILRHK
ncbi:MAG: hypothetical protein LBC56_07805 [Oscillospiraceae bacterium]|nr:hypothetical protein [Oscillospiraceae bacterium]